MSGVAGCRIELMEAWETLEWDQIQGRAVVSEPIADIMVKEGDTLDARYAILWLATQLQQLR